MLVVFLLQLAAGCLLSLAAVRVVELPWRYLRLMAIVALAGLCLAAVVQWRDEPGGGLARPLIATGVAAGLVVAWLMVISGQQPTVRPAQRLWPALSGAAGLAAAIDLALRTVPPEASRFAAAGSLAIGALLAGVVTSAMLLGHRYLTDTGLTIAPLRRMTRLFCGVVAARAIWAAVVLVQRRELFAGRLDPWSWLLLSLRVGVGVVGAAVFAYMVWDCVRRRSTQSATGILYLTMVFVFIGELTGQYLLRGGRLPV